MVEGYAVWAERYGRLTDDPIMPLTHRATSAVASDIVAAGGYRRIAPFSGIC